MSGKRLREGNKYVYHASQETWRGQTTWEIRVQKERCYLEYCVTRVCSELKWLRIPPSDGIVRTRGGWGVPINSVLFVHLSSIKFGQVVVVVVL